MFFCFDRNVNKQTCFASYQIWDTFRRGLRSDSYEAENVHVFNAVCTSPVVIGRDVTGQHLAVWGKINTQEQQLQLVM